MSQLQLQRRIETLERRLASLQTGFQSPRLPVWRVEAAAKPSVSWPTSASTRYFTGILLEPAYETSYSTETLGETDLGLATDGGTSGWINFHSPFYVFEGMKLYCWHHYNQPDNWYVFGVWGDLLCWVPSGGISARSGRTLSSATCDIYYDTGTSITSLTDRDSNQSSGPVFNFFNGAVEGCKFAVIRPGYGGDWYVSGEPCTTDASGSPCTAPS